MKLSKNIILSVLSIGIVLAGFYFFKNRDNAIEILEDTKVQGDYVIEKESRLVLKNNAVLTVEGDLSVKGDIEAEGDLNIVALGNVDISEKANLKFDGNFQLVGEQSSLLKTQKEIDEAFEEAGEKSEDLPSFGPFTDDENDIKNLNDMLQSQTGLDFKKHSFFGARAALASSDTLDKQQQLFLQKNKNIKTEEEPDRTVTIRGTIYGISDKKARREGKIILVKFNSGKVELNLSGLHIYAPDAPDGKSDEDRGCQVKGKNGKKGLRTRIEAYNIYTNDVYIALANGGHGGEARTKNSDCELAKAQGGDGGVAGNLKITARNKLDISGGLTIQPGRSGSGGNAEAVGGDFAKADGSGGDAEAVGGDGGDNKKYLFVSSGVKRGLKIFNIVIVKDGLKVEDVVAGDGGNAFAFGGQGKDGEKCSNNGQRGGDAKAIAGKGGNASQSFILSLPYKTFGGNGGSVNVSSGDGAKGSAGCGGKKGGFGGDGGIVDFSAVGSGGKGDSQGKDGEVFDLAVGFGGDGGDGCPFGRGGEAGKNYSSLPSQEDGENGKDGKDLCKIVVQEEEKDSFISSPKKEEVSLTACLVPDEILNQAYPRDVYSWNRISNSKIEFVRDSCGAKSQSSLKNGAEVWLYDFAEFCPDTKITEILFSGLAKPCSVTYEFAK